MKTGLLLELGSALGLLYAVVLVALIQFQRKLVFQKYPVVWPPRFSERLEASRFVLTTSDGEKLDAVWMAAESPLATILYLHGNATNLRFRASRIQTLNDLGFSILAIDWRGFGKSTGAPSEAGLLLDGEAALNWLARRTELSRVVLLGESLGSGVAIELATRYPVGALVLESPYFSMLDLASTLLPIFPIRALIRDPIRSDLWIGKIRTNLLIQHGRRDRVVPFRQGERLFAIAPEPKRFVGYPRGGHNDLAEKHNSYRDLEQFVIQCFSASGTGRAI